MPNTKKNRFMGLFRTTDELSNATMHSSDDSHAADS